MAFSRWIDHEDSYADRCAWPTVAFHCDCRSGRRHHASADNALRETIVDMGGEAVIPSYRSRKIMIPYDEVVYINRNRIEGCFSRMKHFLRFDSLGLDFLLLLELDGRQHPVPEMLASRVVEYFDIIEHILACLVVSGKPCGVSAFASED